MYCLRWFFGVLMLCTLPSNGANPTLSFSTKDSTRCRESLKLSKSFISSDLDSSAYFADVAADLAHNLMDTGLLASTFDQLGQIHLKKGQWSEAIAYLDSALQLWLSIDDLSGIGKTQLSRGSLYLREGEIFELGSNFNQAKASYNRALEYFQRGLLNFTTAEDSIGMAKSLGNIGMILYRLYREEEAIETLARALSLFQSLDANEHVTTLYSNLGIVYETLGRNDSAAFFYNAARSDFITNDEYFKWINVNVNLAGLYEKTDPQKALVYLFEADSLARSIANIERQALIQQYLYSVFEELGIYKKALNHLKNHYALKDSILSRDFKKEELTIRYQTARQKELIQKQKNKNLKQQLELQRSKSEKHRLLSISIISTLLILGFFAFFLWRHRTRSVIHKHRERLQNERIQKLERQKKLEAANAMLQGQQKERIRVAEDIHDRLGSALVAARMQLEAVTDEENTSLTKARRLINEIILETRNISHNLVSGVLISYGLIPAIEELKEKLEITGQLMVTLNVDGFLDHLNQEIEIELYRITQELVGNALKHSQASELSIQLTLKGNEIILMVQDNGVGFKENKISYGLGLNNMKRRVDKFGGTLYISSTPDKGSTFIIKANLTYEQTQSVVS